MSSILSFHENVTFLQSLVMEEISGCPRDARNHRHDSHGNSSNAARNYNVRRCLRHVQGLLLSDDFVLPPFNIDSIMEYDCDTSASFSPGDPTQRLAPVEKSTAPEFTYNQITQDLMSLLTLDFDGISDNSISRMFEEAIVPRLIDLLETAPRLAPSPLQSLLNHIMYLLQTDSQRENMNDKGEQECVLHQLLDLFNRHVTNHEQLHLVLPNDHDLFLTLHNVLHFQESKTPNKPPSMQLAVLINSLIEYWTFHCLVFDDHTQDHGQSLVGNCCKDIHEWLQHHFIQQQHTYASPEILRQDVDAYVTRVEEYGLKLIESTLRMLEESTSSFTGGGADASRNHSEEVQNAPSLPPMDSRRQDDADDYDVVVLQYATLAANFLAAMQTTTLSLTPGGTAISRSLWREYVHFVVCRLSIASGHGSVERDDCHGVLMHSVDISQGMSDSLDLSVVATDTLLRLSKCHYPLYRSNSSAGISCKNDSIPMITVTILYLWKHASQYWNQDTIDWIHYLLQHYFSYNTSSGKEIRYSIHAIILSHVFFPSDNPESYPKEPLETLTNLVLQDSEQPDPSASTKECSDPWGGWVHGQLSTSCCLDFLERSDGGNRE